MKNENNWTIYKRLLKKFLQNIWVPSGAQIKCTSFNDNDQV